MNLDPTNAAQFSLGAIEAQEKHEYDWLVATMNKAAIDNYNRSYDGASGALPPQPPPQLLKVVETTAVGASWRSWDIVAGDRYQPPPPAPVQSTAAPIASPIGAPIPGLSGVYRADIRLSSSFRNNDRYTDNGDKTYLFTRNETPFGVQMWWTSVS